MKRSFPLVVIAAALLGFVAGHATNSGSRPVLSEHFDDLSLIQQAGAQTNKPETTPRGFNNPSEPQLAPDAPPIMHWSIADIYKAHTEMAEKAAKLASQPGSGSSQSFGGGPVSASTRNLSMFMLSRVHRHQPVLSHTKVNSVWDDAEQHAGVYDFYVFTGGTGQMV